MAKKFIRQNEAAALLGISPEDLLEMRSQGKIHGYRDGAQWVFKSEEIERVANELGESLELREDPATEIHLLGDPASPGVKAPKPPAAQKPITRRIFVSYRRDDSAAMTGRVYDRLEARYGRDFVFMDIDTVPIGIDFRDYIDQSLNAIDVVLVVIGDLWLGITDEGGRRLDNPQDNVRLEIEAALRRRIPVVPLLVGGAPVPKPDQLPESIKDLSYRNALKIDQGLDFHNHVDRLIAGLDRLFQ